MGIILRGTDLTIRALADPPDFVNNAYSNWPSRHQFTLCLFEKPFLEVMSICYCFYSWLLG